jgi:hypothetical protein
VVGTASCGVREAREQMKTKPFVGCLSAAKRRGAERHRRTLVGVHRFDQMARGQTSPPLDIKDTPDLRAKSQRPGGARRNCRAFAADLMSAGGWASLVRSTWR